MGGIFDKGTFRVVDRKRAGKGANILGGRFVLAIKHMETERPANMARFVVQGHADRENPMLINTASTIRQHSVRILVTIAAIYEYALWTQDVAQAYLQAGEGLRREVYVNPPPEFQLGKDKLLRLLKSL